MQLRGYLELMKLRIGFLIALTAMAGYAAIAHQVDAAQLAILFLAMLLGSSGSAVFNQFYDRDIDRLMPRTAQRPLAAGTLGDPRRALWFAGALTLSGALIAVLAFNWIVALHLLLGAFVYSVVYTVWLKRRHWTNIIIGGGAGSFAVLGGAAAVDPSNWLLPTLMAITLFLWTPSHFWGFGHPDQGRLRGGGRAYAAGGGGRQGLCAMDLRKHCALGGVGVVAGGVRFAGSNLRRYLVGVRRPVPVAQLAAGGKPGPHARAAELPVLHAVSRRRVSGDRARPPPVPECAGLLAFKI